MKFARAWLREEGGRTVYNKIIGHHRWTVEYERVFEHDGRFYRTRYNVGATEKQYEGPYEYQPDEVECPEVFPLTITQTAYLTEEEL